MIVGQFEMNGKVVGLEIGVERDDGPVDSGLFEVGGEVVQADAIEPLHHARIRPNEDVVQVFQTLLAARLELLLRIVELFETQNSVLQRLAERAFSIYAPFLRLSQNLPYFATYR